jgi:hemerythrin-like domain-containing protein
MRATAVLKSEHRVIERVLTCLEAIAERAQGTEPLDVASARRALDFFQHFADRCHHGKEERCLFPLMEACGFLREGGPTGVMLHEHETGRQYLRDMAESVERAAAGDRDAVRRFAVQVRAYSRLLREHIFKEDNRLFVMADHVLSSADQEALLRSFGTMETHDMGEGTHERYLRLADELAERYHLPKRAAAGNAAACGHCGCHAGH